MTISIVLVWIASSIYYVIHCAPPVSQQQQLTIEELCEEYKDAFELYDRDKDGFIDADDAKKFFKLSNENPKLLGGMPYADREEVKDGILNTIQELNGKMTLSQFAIFAHDKRVSTDITLEDIYRIQGDEPKTQRLTKRKRKKKNENETISSAVELYGGKCGGAQRRFGKRKRG